jgi:hypothetical protein
MCIYSDPTDPFENSYVPDLMQSALEEIAHLLADQSILVSHA